MTFSIQRITHTRAVQCEPLGSKPKVWLDGDQTLFKGEVRGTGADWAEVVASHLCQLLGLPHVGYHLAELTSSGVTTQRGVVCGNMAPGDKELVLGNQLLLHLDSSYPSEQRWKVRQHTVDAVTRALKLLSCPATDWTADAPPGIGDALGFFIGYVMLDAWIANQDRHHENWGAIRDPLGGQLHLAPTFDHGAGLACILTDSERQRRLTTRDRNDEIEAFCSRARSGFTASPADKKTLASHSAFWLFARNSPAQAQVWLDRLLAVSENAVWGILAEVPEHLMSPICREFTCRLLTINRTRLLKARPQ